MRFTSKRRLRVGTVGLAAAALLLSACAESERGDEGEEGGGGTFVFAGAAEPELLDPAFASDGETFRVARQMFEGLVVADSFLLKNNTREMLLRKKS